MKKIIFGLLSVLLTVAGHTQPDACGVIPKPANMQFRSGSFKLTPGTAIYVNSEEARPAGDLLKERIEDMFHVAPEVKESKREKQGINIIYDNQFEIEAYQLTVEGNSVIIKGNQAGIFYGLQTFLQLMPEQGGTEIQIPNVQIEDKPRFAYRGAMLDVGRYFFPTRYIKRFIDLIAFYKLNTLHLHLTEDAGWRIEIKKYPKLTEIGAWRQGTQRGKPAAETYDRLPHGGYYTQEEIRELVAYAREKQVTIVPEIDLPGHTLAMLAAYPELSCTGGPFKVLEHWGIQEDVLCMGNDDTYKVVEDILEELIALFPSEIIHIGGDEAPKERWSHCPKCQAVMAREKMQDERELQGYFTKRMASFLESKGRRLIGWDEILEGGIASNAMVMSWRGEKGGIAAAQQKHEVVMSPSSFLYLDYYQGNPENEPFNIGGNLPLEKVYGYEPWSDQLKKEEQQYIVGVQGNLWMEFIHGEDKLEYMGFPRLIALAEIGWSPQGKDYAGFTKRLKSNLPWLDRQQVNYRIPEPYGLKDTKTTEPVVRVELEAPVQGATILYTLNGDDPLLKGISYSKPIELRLDSEPVKIKCVVRTSQGRVSGAYMAKYSRVNADEGVQIGAITYSYRSMPDQSLAAILDYVVQSGLSSVELMGGPVEAYAGAPQGKDATKLAEWRTSVSMDKFKEVKKLFRNKGVTIDILKLGDPKWSDAEIDYAFNVCKTLGARGITMEISEEAAKRMAPFAEKHKLYVIFHNHGQPGNPDFSFDKVLAHGPMLMLNLDAGHYFGATGNDPCVLIERLHDRIASIHIKDKTGPKAAEPDKNQPFGMGETPVKEILRLVQKNNWPITCDIELEYTIPQGSDAVKEVTRCVEYCRAALINR